MVARAPGRAPRRAAPRRVVDAEEVCSIVVMTVETSE